MATTIRNEKLFCDKCGKFEVIKYPIAIPDLISQTDKFEELHEYCRQIWIEPVASLVGTIREKAMWWIANGQHGMSSKTMWNCFMDNKKFPINHPHDPDDFSRCWKLLEAVPEWKEELHKLKPLSEVWSNLVDNWDKLTEMYETNVADNWVNSKEVGMFDLMQELTNINEK